MPPIDTDSHAELLKSQYEFFGNFVHGKYPETMMVFDPDTARIRLNADRKLITFHVLPEIF